MSTTTSSPQQPIPTMSDSRTEEEPTAVKSSSDPITSTPDPAESSTGGTPPADQQNESQETLEDEEPKNKEAAKYRVRLREAEAERDTLAAKLNSVTDNVISEKLRHFNIGIKALKASGADLSDLYDRDGTFSDEALLAAVESAHESLGLPADRALNAALHSHQSRGVIDWSRDPREGYVPSSGTGLDGPAAIQGSGWDSVINPSR